MPYFPPWHRHKKRVGIKADSLKFANVCFLAICVTPLVHHHLAPRFTRRTLFCQSPFFALGNKPSFFTVGAQNTISHNFFPKSFEKRFLAFAGSQIYAHSISPPFRVNSTGAWHADGIGAPRVSFILPSAPMLLLPHLPPGCCRLHRQPRLHPPQPPRHPMPFHLPRGFLLPLLQPAAGAKQSRFRRG